MNLDEYSDQQERLTRLEAMEDNVEWIKENWENADSVEISKRLGLIKGDADRLVQMSSENGEGPGDSLGQE